MKITSSKIIFLSAAVCLLVILNLGKYKKGNVIVHDVVSYYSYLPAFFIEHDLRLTFLDDPDFKIPPNAYWSYKFPDGSHVLKMTIGLSVMYMPFYLLAHGAVIVFNLEATGFSTPYQLSLCIAALFYFTLAFTLLRKVLLNYFEDKIVAIVLVILCFGTNLFYYVSYESGMSHCYSFFLFSLILFLNIKWHQNTNWRNTIFLGLIIGLTILVRVSNIVVVLIPLFYKVYNTDLLKEKLIFFKKHFSKLLVASICIFLVQLPQLFYWKHVTGEWLFYSYRNEHFYFSNPHIAPMLFSFRKGWFIYTPLMILFVIGIFYLKEKTKDYFLMVIIFFIANTYIMSSWWCWWYGGSYGLRPMIDSYPLLAIPVGAVIQRLFKTKLIYKRACFTIISIFVCWNIYLTYQYKRGIIWYDGMTAKSYSLLFYNFHKPDNFQEFISMPDEEAALKGEEKYEWK